MIFTDVIVFPITGTWFKDGSNRSSIFWVYHTKHEFKRLHNLDMATLGVFDYKV